MKWVTLTARGLHDLFINGALILGVATGALNQIGVAKKYMEMRTRGEPIATCNEEGRPPVGQPFCQVDFQTTMFYRMYAKIREDVKGIQIAEKEFDKFAATEIVAKEREAVVPKTPIVVPVPKPITKDAHLREKSRRMNPEAAPKPKFGPKDVFDN